MEYLNLEQYKASGIYTIEIDASQSLTIPLTTGRILFGSSRRGPINTVVLVNDTKVARNVYGARDFFLENKGSYFHKDLAVMLGEGPTYAMNIVPIDLLDESAEHPTNLDKAAFVPFNVESMAFNDTKLQHDQQYPATGIAHTSPLKNYYNRQKFWFASEVELTKTKNKETSAALKNDIISIANLGKRPVTVFIQKASIPGYELTAKEWYSSSTGENVIPNFIHQDDFISDYMIDIIVVEGDWTNYARLAVDPVYASYFTARGLRADKANDFLVISEVVVVTRQTGCLIPDFTDKGGRTIAIDRVFNNQYPLTELIMSIDYERLEQYDLSTSTYSEADVTTYRMDILGHGLKSMVDQAGVAPVNAFDDSYDLNDTDPTNYPEVNAMIDVLSYRKPIHAQYSYYYTTAAATLPTEIVMIDAGSPAGHDCSIHAYEDSALYKLWKAGHLVSGDYNPVFNGGSPAIAAYIKISEANGTGALANVKKIIIQGYSDKTLVIPSTLSLDETLEAVTFVTCQSSSSNTPVTQYSTVFEENANLTIQKTAPNKIRLVVDNTYVVAIDLFKYIKPGYYLQAKVANGTGRPRTLRILSVAKISVDTGNNTTTYEIITMLPNDINVEGIDIVGTTGNAITTSFGIYNYATALRGYKIDEFVLRANSLPGGNFSWMGDGTVTDWKTAIYKFLFDSGLDKAMNSGERLNVRHMVDSYEGQISESSKYYLIKLGANHAKTLVFANTPSMKQFENSTDPTFIDPFTGLLNAQYIADGGNFQYAPPSFTYKIASGIENGVPIESFAIMSMPNLVISEGNKNRSMPAAAYVSNAYIRKYTNGNTYGLVAGKRGVITEPEVIGVEYDLTDDDRKILEPVGYNMIIRRRGIGTMLFSNNTCYQKVQSALNNAHVRDTLITIEQDIERILYNFLFSFNDGITQIRVKTLVENYLDNVLSSRGISWYSVQMDASNNGQDVLEANAGVIDVLVDFPRGIHKFINRITITRKGGQLSALQSGFGQAA